MKTVTKNIDFPIFSKYDYWMLFDIDLSNNSRYFSVVFNPNYGSNISQFFLIKYSLSLKELLFFFCPKF